MRFYTKADAALLAQATIERNSLLMKVEHLNASLEAARKETIAALDRLAEAKASPAKVETQPPTKEQIARMLRIPEHLIDQIDLDRMGVQVSKTRHQ